MRGRERERVSNALSPQLFAIFSTLIEDACGLHYGPKDRDILATKIVGHATDAGYDNLLDFYYRLRYDDPSGEVMKQLVEALLVHETYFFRELPPLQYLADHFLPAVIAKRGSARVWSAACATGEEPLTLAMLLDRGGILDRVAIVATDISEGAIQQAASGRHGRRSLREGHPPTIAQAYLDQTANGVTVAQKIQDAVKFSTLNLLTEAPQLGTFDVILCRNVLIYFRDDQIARVIQRLSNHLAIDGLLAVGVSESLLRFGTSLTCEERGSSYFYRRAR